jgi:signal transduction histidine kinase/ActR/RegA family two-component response regulator
MRIKTQFIIAMILFGVMLMIVSASLIITNRQVDRLSKQEEIAHRLERDASELGYLSNDYLLYRESQQRTRWESKFSSFSSDLSNLGPDSPEQEAIANNMRENLRRWQAVFADVAETLSGESELQNDSTAQTFLQLAWSRMAVQNQGIVFDAMRLAELLRNQKDRLRERHIVLIVALLVIFGAYFIANYAIVYRHTLKSLSDLHAGTQIIGSGNLDYVIQAKYRDEIGELSHAFNKMTANLKRITASKADLEREMAQRRKAEEQLRQSHDELEMRVQERTAELEQRARQLSLLASELTLAEERERRRLAGILHDNLQQLLVAAKMRIEVLSGTVETEYKSKAENILGLIQESLNVSRSLTAELSPPLLQLGGLSAALKWLGRWMGEIHGLQVDLSVDPLLDPKREDYSVLLFQSVRELLFNVVKHSGVTSARVDVRKDEEGQHRIVVSDQGIGLDSEAFWKNANAGTGFGLFGIRERMTLMGGRLEVESRPGMGATFSLVLPSEETESPEAAASEIKGGTLKTVAGRSPAPDRRDKIRVMLVDDHELVRNGLSTLIGNNRDIEIVGELSDGEEAVRSAREILPDVILMDINMAKMNGLEATRRIHSELPRIRIICLSMYEDNDLVSAAFNAGASAFLTKSGSSDTLLSAIRGQADYAFPDSEQQ